MLVLEGGEARGSLDVQFNRVELVQADDDEVVALIRAGFVMPVARVGCMERVCTCHDDHGWTYPGSYPDGCSFCGCRRPEVHP